MMNLCDGKLLELKVVDEGVSSKGGHPGLDQSEMDQSAFSRRSCDLSVKVLYGCVQYQPIRASMTSWGCGNVMGVVTSWGDDVM